MDDPECRLPFMVADRLGIPVTTPARTVQELGVWELLGWREYIAWEQRQLRKIAGAS